MLTDVTANEDESLKLATVAILEDVDLIPNEHNTADGETHQVASESFVKWLQVNE